MRTSRRRTYAPLALLVACGGGTVARDGDTAAADPRANLADPPRGETLPPVAAEALPGWIGLVTVDLLGKRAIPWAPAWPEVQVAVFGTVAELPAGAIVVAVPSDGDAQPARSVGASVRPYGCDSTPTDMTGFETAAPLAQGPVWLLRSEDAGRLLPRAAPVVPLRQDVAVGAWRADGVQVTLTRTTDLTAKLAVERDGRFLLEQEEKKYFMDGAEEGPIDLSAEIEIGMPRPIGAYVLDATEQVVLVFWMHSYEGNHLRVLLVDQASATWAESFAEYVYLCAF